MTSDNLGLVQSIYEAFGRGDVPAIAAGCTPDTNWNFNVAASEVPWHVPATSVRDLPGFFSALADNVDFTRFEPRRFIADGRDVVVLVRLAYTVKRTGRQVEEEQVQWWTVRDGRIAGLRHFEDTAQVVAAWRG